MYQWKDIHQYFLYFQAWLRKISGYNKVGLWKFLHWAMSLQLAPSFPPFPKANMCIPKRKEEANQKTLKKKGLKSGFYGNAECKRSQNQMLSCCCYSQVKDAEEWDQIFPTKSHLSPSLSTQTSEQFAKTSISPQTPAVGSSPYGVQHIGCEISSSLKSHVS